MQKQYEFRNKRTGEVFVGPLMAFCKKYRLNPYNVDYLIRGLLQSERGWMLEEEYLKYLNNPERYRMLKVKKDSYTFKNTVSFATFIGTEKELCQAHKLHPENIAGLVKGEYKSVAHWVVV